MFQKKVALAAIWAVVLSLAWGCLSTGVLRDIETRTWDWRLRFISKRQPHNPKIKIIMIDQTSLDHFASKEKLFWPWPRALYVPVLRFLTEAGAKAVAFDMLFTESSRELGDDAEFASAIKSSIPVISAVSLRRDRSAAQSENEALFADLQKPKADAISKFVEGRAQPVYPFAVLPIPEIMRASVALGNVTTEPDEDKMFRRTPVLGYLQDIPVFNLPFAMFHAVEPAMATGRHLTHLMDASGKLLIRFFGPAATYDSFSIHAVINSWLELEEGRTPAIPLAEFKDAYVFIGASAPGLLDLRSVPVGGAYSGVEINATIFDNLVQKSFLRELSTRGAMCVTMLLLACASGIVLLQARYQLIGAVSLVGGWVGACFYFASVGWWVPMIVPTLGVSLVLLLGFFLQYQLEGKQHRFIKNAFQHFVTPHVIQKIIADPSLLALGGERKELTMFFADLVGFTTLSEKLEPAELVRFINSFLSEMTDVILSFEGTIDKYEGDAIIAFWNAPLAIADHQDRAVKAAVRCQERLRECSKRFERDFNVKAEMRVGINTGIVTVGNFGSASRFNYTMIGDAANIAARLEGANRIFGTRILVSEETKGGIREQIYWRRVASVRLKGKNEATQIYEPLDSVVQRTIIERLTRYEAAVGLFESGDLVKAKDAFGEFSDDPVSRSYLARISRIQEGVEDWSAVWILTEK